MAADEDEDNVSAPAGDAETAAVDSDLAQSESGGAAQRGESEDQTVPEKASLQMSEDALALQKELESIKVVAPDISV